MVQVAKLDHSFLVELGLGHLDDDQQRYLLRRIYEVLGFRVGQIVSSSLTNAQRDAFEQLIERDPELAQDFLENAIPNYALVAHSELNEIARTIAQSIRRGAVVVGGAKAREQVDG